MTGENLKRRTPYVITVISIVILGAFVLLLYPQFKAKKERPARETGQQISNSGTASSKRLDKLMRSLGIQKMGKDVAAPDFELDNLDGKKVRLKDYRGKIILLNFMATWCHWCRKEMPSLQKLYEQFKDQDFVIVAVFSDREGARAVVPFVEKSGYTFFGDSGLLDPTGRVDTLYGITGTPTSYLINREGKMIGREIGYRDWFTQGTRDLIEGLLKSK
ncbi:MAG: TlpA family protein disulfide reductase [Nitrospirae bacterium]|nr:TlpA family protein disulfide reductase [Nitrospirota bacterium]